MPDIIYNHEDWQGIDFGSFVADTWINLKRSWPMPKFPDFPVSASVIEAYINEGRWIAECPAGCGNAVVPEKVNPTFLCLSPPHICPAPKQWFKVEYPRLKRAIEIELLKRPAKRAFFAANRHWLPGESLNKLREETIAGGIV